MQWFSTQVTISWASGGIGGGPGFTTRNFASREAAALAGSKRFFLSSKICRSRPDTLSKWYSLGLLTNFLLMSMSVSTKNYSTFMSTLLDNAPGVGVTDGRRAFGKIPPAPDFLWTNALGAARW